MFIMGLDMEAFWRSTWEEFFSAATSWDDNAVCWEMGWHWICEGCSLWVGSNVCYVWATSMESTGFILHSTTGTQIERQSLVCIYFNFSVWWQNPVTKRHIKAVSWRNHLFSLEYNVGSTPWQLQVGDEILEWFLLFLVFLSNYPSNVIINA